MALTTPAMISSVLLVLRPFFAGGGQHVAGGVTFSTRFSALTSVCSQGIGPVSDGGVMEGSSRSRHRW